MEKNDELARIAYEHRLYQSQLQELQRQAQSAQNAAMEVSATATGIKALANIGKEGTLMGLGSGAFTEVSPRDAQKVLVEVGAGVFVEKTAEEAVQTMEERRKKIDEALQKMGASMEAVSRRLEALEEKAEALG